MPGKLKVKIVAGRHLPVMDRASDLTDAFVEVGKVPALQTQGAPSPVKDPSHPPSPQGPFPAHRPAGCGAWPALPGELTAETAALVMGARLAGVSGTLSREGRLLLLCLQG